MPNEAAHDMLAPALSLGPVALNVQNLERMKEFYTSVIGLEVLTESNDIVLLGQKKTAIIELHKRPDLPRSIPGDAGLYHHAIVFSSRSLLAQAVERVLHYVPHLFAGSADHLVSEAFYLSDPEGNGMELYYDRDPATWTWENGEVKMATLYLSPDEYINLHAPKKETGTMHMGHVHLKIGTIEQAQKFYIDTIGFSMTARMPSALFMSINKYHHHLGMNSWESEGADKRPETLGLKEFTIMLPESSYVDALQKRLRNAELEPERTDTQLIFSDPWNNRIIVSTPFAEPVT